MNINHADIHDGAAAVVDLEGQLDSFSSPGCEDYINGLLAGTTRSILLDGGNLQYVSSEGIGLLLFLQKKISEKNGFFVLFNLSDETLTLFRLIGFDRIFRIADTRPDALQLLDRLIETGGIGLEENEGLTAEDDALAGFAVDDRPIRDDAEQGWTGSVVACAGCGSQVRVRGDGSYLCPHCNADFTVVNQRITIRRDDSGGSGHADFSPIVVECAKCRSLVRVKKSGSYLCPDCDTQFRVSPDQSVEF